MCTIPGKPTIKGLVPVDTELHSLSPYGGDTIILTGKNLGPDLTVVTYGPTSGGVFNPNCTYHESTSNVICTTTAGNGAGFHFRAIAMVVWVIQVFTISPMKNRRYMVVSNVGDNRGSSANFRYGSVFESN